MKSKKTTRRALLTSVMALILCCAMLVGSTFAWFTDSVTSVNNVIKSGNLDVEVYNGLTTNDKKLEEVEKLFSKVELWEPGVVSYENLTVANLGSLALKYAMNVNFTNENKLNGYGLSQILKVAVVEGGVEEGTTREALIAGISNWQTMADFAMSGELYPVGNAEGHASEETYGLVIYWEPTDDDNNWNVNNGQTADDGKDHLRIDLGINLFATQLTYEEDSFDDQYDAYSAVSTVAEANKLMAEGKDAVLLNCNDPAGVLEIPAGYTGTLTLVNSAVKSVQAEENANIVILGNVTVNAKEGTPAGDGSAITAKGKLNISGTGTLTAIAADVKGAFGIGGMETTEITAKGITVDYVSGSFAYGVGSDTKYYKDAPEGGAAIGSGFDGAVITLDDVTVNKAIGGSKAAGIGARYWTGVTVNIKDSTINYVEGGVSAAGIGGSRVSSKAKESGTTINITNSTVTAQGGAYGAGIGSGYDTHCGTHQPLCTVNITDSTVNATGGKYAAGVGSGYHNAALAGEIKGGTVNAVSGEKIYKAAYTPAMDMGFGVVDPAREGQQTDSYLIVNGTKITLGSAPSAVTSNDELDKAITDGSTDILLGNGTFIIPDSAQGKTLTITGSGDTVIATQDDGSYEGCDYSLDGATVTFNNIIINTDSSTYTGYARCSGTYNNCTINGTYTLYGDSTFTGCTFNVSGDVYNIWTWGAPTATFTGCTFNSDGKAMLLYGTENTKLTLTNCVFNDKGGLTDKKAAVEIGNDYNKSYELIVNNTVVNGYEINDKGINTGTTLWGNKNSMGTDKLNVVVDGVDVY